MKRNLQKGFTLIELLVVIAIIGILSAIVMIALNSARSKGSSAGIKSHMTSLRNQAELYYNTTGNKSYGLGGLVAAGNCPGTSALFLAGTNSLSGIINGILADGVPVLNTWCATNGTTVTNATAWAVAVIDPGVPGGTSALCIDSLRATLRSVTITPANTPGNAISAGSCI